MRLGADPEIFLMGRKDGQFKSIIGKIGGDKHHPVQIPTLPSGFTLQEDNVALEFGIPPAASSAEFVRNIRTAMLAGIRALPGERFSRLSCTIFPKEEMNHPSAFVFGCEPDYNAWTQQENPRPEPKHVYMRSAGGHVHIETKLDKENVIRACDLFLGVPSVLMDTGVERRALYGKAGAFRPKPYGVEYRTLSNFWIFKPRLIDWVWRNTERALDEVAETNGYMDWSFVADDVQHCINNGDKKLAEQLVKEFELEVV